QSTTHARSALALRLTHVDPKATPRERCASAASRALLPRPARNAHVPRANVPCLVVRVRSGSEPLRNLETPKQRFRKSAEADRRFLSTPRRKTKPPERRTATTWQHGEPTQVLGATSAPKHWPAHPKLGRCPSHVSSK